MRFHHDHAELYIPDGASEAEAFERTTHLGIGAHQDDLEIMAYHGIAACYGRRDSWFGGVTCTNGSGSSRTGLYADLSDEEMMRVRREEQRKAAFVGEYSFIAQLAYPSAQVKDPSDSRLREDLFHLLEATRPGTVYTHNPADKHSSHIAVVIPTILAIRDLPADARPRWVLGCEVWRNLDWLGDDEKVGLDVSERPNLASALVGLFDSQISGGKRYDLATLGRWHANATYFDSHGTDQSQRMIYAMDLSTLIAEPTVDIVDYVISAIDRFREDVRASLERQLGRR